MGRLRKLGPTVSQDVKGLGKLWVKVIRNLTDREVLKSGELKAENSGVRSRRRREPGDHRGDFSP